MTPTRLIAQIDGIPLARFFRFSGEAARGPFFAKTWGLVGISFFLFALRHLKPPTDVFPAASWTRVDFVGRAGGRASVFFYEYRPAWASAPSPWQDLLSFSAAELLHRPRPMAPLRSAVCQNSGAGGPSFVTYFSQHGFSVYFSARNNARRAGLFFAGR